MKKLRLTKASWIFLSVGIFVVAIISLGLTRSQQLQEQDQLDQELRLTETRLGKLQVEHLSQQREELQVKLDESTQQLAEAKDKLRQTVESIDVTDEFYAIAYSCGVEIDSISSSAIKSEDLEGVSCSMITINAAVVGELPNLIDLVITLNHDFTTGIVKSASISVVEESNEEDESSANIHMVVYAYEGG